MFPVIPYRSDDNRLEAENYDGENMAPRKCVPGALFTDGAVSSFVTKTDMAPLFFPKKTPAPRGVEAGVKDTVLAVITRG